MIHKKKNYSHHLHSLSGNFNFLEYSIMEITETETVENNIFEKLLSGVLETARKSLEFWEELSLFKTPSVSRVASGIVRCAKRISRAAEANDSPEVSVTPSRGKFPAQLPVWNSTSKAGSFSTAVTTTSSTRIPAFFKADGRVWITVDIVTCQNGIPRGNAQIHVFWDRVFVTWHLNRRKYPTTPHRWCFLWKRRRCRRIRCLCKLIDAAPGRVWPSAYLLHCGRCLSTNFQRAQSSQCSRKPTWEKGVTWHGEQTNKRVIGKIYLYIRLCRLFLFPLKVVRQIVWSDMYVSMYVCMCVNIK